MKHISRVRLMRYIVNSRYRIQTVAVALSEGPHLRCWLLSGLRPDHHREACATLAVLRRTRHL